MRVFACACARVATALSPLLVFAATSTHRCASRRRLSARTLQRQTWRAPVAAHAPADVTCARLPLLTCTADQSCGIRPFSHQSGAAPRLLSASTEAQGRGHTEGKGAAPGRISKFGLQLEKQNAGAQGPACGRGSMAAQAGHGGPPPARGRRGGGFASEQACSSRRCFARPQTPRGPRPGRLRMPSVA